MQVNRSFEVQCADKRATVSVIPTFSEGGVEEYRISVCFSEKAVPPTVTVTWYEDMVETLHVWHPLIGSRHTMHQAWHANRSESCFHCGAPILSTIGEKGKNRRTVALSDPITPSSLRFGIMDMEQKNRVAYSAVLFDGRCDARKEYEVCLRIDGREIPFCEATQEVYSWWETQGWQIPTPPEAAEDAVYSTWYNFHQEPRQELLLEELRIASELGFRTVILDDGWQIAGRAEGNYANCGEWQVSPDRFPDFRGFCQEVHSLGMKLAVWFSVPFVGVDSALYSRFEGMYLCPATDSTRHGILDPRFPEVRTYIRSNYERFLREYDVDGFKLDYVDAFAVGGEIPAFDSLRMDCETVGGAVLLLLEEVKAALTAIKQGLLFEYRQRYVGPAVNGFGNMLRVGDCAYDAHINRVEIVNLRLLGYPTAVHSDMLFWSPEESEGLCVRQLLNVLFSVPQISVRLTQCASPQKEILRAYLSYWRKHRNTILHGRFSVENVEQNFTRISAEAEGNVIVVQHGDFCYTYDGRSAEVHHNGNEEGLVIENPTDRVLLVRTFLRFGQISLGCCEIPSHTIQRIPLPLGGMAEIVEK